MYILHDIFLQSLLIIQIWISVIHISIYETVPDHKLHKIDNLITNYCQFVILVNQTKTNKYKYNKQIEKMYNK